MKLNAKALSYLQALPAGLLEQSAQILGVDTTKVKTVTIVEAGPVGLFDANGNPACLFERHKAWEYLSTVLRVDPNWVRSKYPYVAHLIDERPTPKGGYGTYAEQIKKFNLLAKIDEPFAFELAVAACSWGGWQILGYNWKVLGYDSAHAFFKSMGTAQGQLEAFVRYIQVFKLADALREGDWDAFARGYNGRNYKKWGYDVKLAETYQWLVKQKAPRKSITQSVSAQSTAGGIGLTAVTVGTAIYKGTESPTPPVVETITQTAQQCVNQCAQVVQSGIDPQWLWLVAGLQVVGLILHLIVYYRKNQGL